MDKKICVKKNLYISGIYVFSVKKSFMFCINECLKANFIDKEFKLEEYFLIAIFFSRFYH